GAGNPRDGGPPCAVQLAADVSAADTDSRDDAPAGAAGGAVAGALRVHWGGARAGLRRPCTLDRGGGPARRRRRAGQRCRAARAALDAPPARPGPSAAMTWSSEVGRVAAPIRARPVAVRGRITRTRLAGLGETNG